MQDLTPQQEKELRMAYIQTFGTEAGQKVLKDLEARCFKRHSTYNTEINMVREEIFINEGKRQMLLHIEELMSDEGIQRLTGSAERK